MIDQLIELNTKQLKDFETEYMILREEYHQLLLGVIYGKRMSVPNPAKLEAIQQRLRALRQHSQNARHQLEILTGEE